MITDSDDFIMDILYWLVETRRGVKATTLKAKAKDLASLFTNDWVGTR